MDMGMDMHRKSHGGRLARRAGIATLLLGLALALPGQARPGQGHHGWGGPSGWIERHAEELGIDDATLAEIDRIVDASREEAEAIYQEHRAARDRMHELLEQDDPDVDAVMKQAEVIGEIDVRKHKHRIATMLEIRSKLTPEQRTELRALKDEMRERHGGRHEHGRHHGGECRHGDDAGGEEL
jgi:Spy/CpxP family protein refolding chaperone